MIDHTRRIPHWLEGLTVVRAPHPEAMAEALQDYRARKREARFVTFHVRKGHSRCPYVLFAWPVYFLRTDDFGSAQLVIQMIFRPDANCRLILHHSGGGYFEECADVYGLVDPRPYLIRLTP